MPRLRDWLDEWGVYAALVAALLALAVAVVPIAVRMTSPRESLRDYSVVYRSVERASGEWYRCALLVSGDRRQVTLLRCEGEGLR